MIQERTVVFLPQRKLHLKPPVAILETSLGCSYLKSHLGMRRVGLSLPFSTATGLNLLQGFAMSIVWQEVLS